MRRASAAIALLASFSVYLIPLIGPHAAPLLGEMFFGDMYRSSPAMVSYRSLLQVWSSSWLRSASFTYFFKREVLFEDWRLA